MLLFLRNLRSLYWLVSSAPISAEPRVFKLLGLIPLYCNELFKVSQCHALNTTHYDVFMSCWQQYTFFQSQSHLSTSKGFDGTLGDIIYNCFTFLESSGQFDQTIYRVNIWGYFDSVPKYRVNLVYFDPTSK